MELFLDGYQSIPKAITMEKTALLQEIRHTFERLYSALRAFNEDTIDRIPFPGSWTAGQVAEHLIKGLSGIGRMGAKTTKTDRPADQKIPEIKKVFLDYSMKMTSPEFILPTADTHDLHEQLAAFKHIEEQHLGMAEDADLSLESLVFELPGFGAFTLYEWISFNLIHAQRHTRQLHKISQAF